MTQGSLARAITKKIMWRVAKGKVKSVVVHKPGKPPRVYDLDKYLQRQERTKQVRPWEHRRDRKHAAPLPTIKGTVLTPITREYMYE